MSDGGPEPVRRVALTGLAAGVAAVGVAYGSAFLPGPAPEWAPWLMAGGTVGSIVAAMALGAVKGDRLGSLAATFAAVLLLVGGGFFAILALPPTDPADPALVLGLPLRAALLLYGIGLLPTLLVPVAYALTFDRLTLSDADLERVRGARRREPDPSPRSFSAEGDAPAGGAPRPGAGDGAGSRSADR